MDAPHEAPETDALPVAVAYVIVYEDAAGEYRWKAMAANNHTVADSGEGYKNRSYAEKVATDLFPLAILTMEA